MQEPLAHDGCRSLVRYEMVAAILTSCSASALEEAPVPAITTSVEARECSREELMLGPVTVAGSWGPTARMGCRTGPSPLEEAKQWIRTDTLLHDCLRSSSVTDLEIELTITPSGTVDRVDVLECDRPRSEVDGCLRRLELLSVHPMGCTWRLRERW